MGKERWLDGWGRGVSSSVLERGFTWGMCAVLYHGMENLAVTWNILGFGYMEVFYCFFWFAVVSFFVGFFGGDGLALRYLGKKSRGGYNL